MALCDGRQCCVMAKSVGGCLAKGLSGRAAYRQIQSAPRLNLPIFEPLQKGICLFTLDYLLRFKQRSFGGARDLPGFGCSLGREEQQLPSSKCTWKRPSISNIPTPRASPGFKAAIIHVGGLHI